MSDHQNNSIFIKARHRTSQLVDKLGCPIDAGILDTVTILRLHGINTIGSCEGHIERVTSGPYIMFEAREAHLYRAKYQDIDKTNPIFRKLYEEARRINMQEVKKMLSLLEGFYNDRLVLNNQHLIVRCFGASIGELMCQGADIAATLDDKGQKELLASNQQEMLAFTNYLIQIYFEDKKLRPLAQHES